MLDPLLRATLEQRVREMEVAKTVDASPTATIKPAPRPPAETRPGPDPSRLPRISLGGADDQGPAPAGASRDLELGTLLGEGGMGRVHVAFQRSLEREVAIKVLRDGAAPSSAAALLREAVVTGTLEHPGIVPVHALGVDDAGAPVLVMKRIEGVQWGDLVRDPSHPAWAKRPGDRQTAHVEIVTQMCRTLEFAHARGVVHRDIKPENVMLGDFGEVYVVDWGIAVRLAGQTSEASLAGTPACMAPEMVMGAEIDPRTDVYLLGASLHEALTGRARNAGDTMETVLAAALAPAPYDYGPDVPGELAAICNRATARDPKDRFDSAERMRLALAEYLQHRGSAALAGRARERCDELEAVLAAAKGAPADLQRSYQLASEARFACAEALRTWPDNARAKQELERCLGLIVELELRQDHLRAAEAAAREIEHPSPALVERLERARVAHAAAADERARLVALAKDLDVRVASRQRTVGLVLLCLGSLAVAGALARGVRVDGRAMVGLAVVFLVIATTVTGLLREKLLANAFNRRASTMLLVGLAVVAAARGAALAGHLSIAQTVVQDLVVVLAFTVASAITLLPWLWLVVPIDLAAIAVALAAPERAQLGLALCLALLPPVAWFALHRAAQRAR